MASESRPKKRKAPRSAWKPGQTGNPGGVPKGKRISTWMLELGAMSDKELDAIEPSLPAFGQIALARVRAAKRVEGGEKSTEIVLERTEGKVPVPVEASLTETKRIVFVFPDSKA